MSNKKQKPKTELFDAQNLEITEFEFEGKKVKQMKNGYWKCPFGCHTDNRFPQPKWKTLKGIKSHLENCPETPSVINKKKSEKQAILDTLEALKNEFLNSFPYKLGDEISYVRKIVVKGTHERRYNRDVRVRYEPILRFEATKAVVQSIDFLEPYKIPDLEYLQVLVRINRDIMPSQIIEYEKAVIVAHEKTIADEEFRKHAAMCR